jgi:DUF1680 family protein
VALARGPIVYALEGVDNVGQVRNVFLPKDVKIEATYREKLLNGVTVLTATAKSVDETRAASDVKSRRGCRSGWRGR